MNARVDPARLEPANADFELTALCRRASTAIETYRAAEDDLDAAQKRYIASRPAYPKLAWSYSPAGEGSAELRERLEAEGAAKGAAWRKGMRAQIAAVRAWERADRAIATSTGFDKAERRAIAAYNAMGELVRAVGEKTSATVLGASWKALVATQWLATGLAKAGDEAWAVGEQLIQSVLFDIRHHGAGGTNGGRIKRVERLA